MTPEQDTSSREGLRQQVERMRASRDDAQRTAEDALKGWKAAIAARDGLSQQLEAASVAYYLLRDERDAVATERDQARAALDRVRDLHVEHACTERPCPTCLGMGPCCAECGQDPCPTLAAIDGGET